MKKTSIILIAILALVAVFMTACSDLTTGLSSSGNNETLSPSNESSSTVTEEEVRAASEEAASTASELEATDYLSAERTAVSKEQMVSTASEEGATIIDLSSLTAENAPSGTTFKKSVLTIQSAGTYVLSGTLNGAVEVAKNVEGAVRIVLNGATIKTTDSQSAAAIVFKQASDLRILTIADGTTNEVSDSAGDTAADGDGAAIQAKKCSLTINGSGTLTVTAVGEDASGIKVKDSLTVLDATLRVTAVKNGIKADNAILLKGANVTVSAGNDAIKTDIEPETEEEALAYAADPTAGYIYIEHTSLSITAGDDGICANNCLYIANGDEDLISIKTNGGAPTTVTESSSDAADGKAIKVSGIFIEDENENETDYPATFDGGYAIVITGGAFSLDSNDDAIHSEGNLFLSGGSITIASGDDGLHAERLVKISGGSVTVTKSYEGIEGAAVEIAGGTINVSAKDDGINAANADLKDVANYILITGGTITVNCSGDGVDSNGKLLISGGTVTVFGPENGGNSALDSETGTTISGGTVITTCRESMDPVGSTQYRVSANLSVSAGTTLTLKDSSGKTIASFVAPKSCRNILISTPEMTAGSYTLSYGTASVTLTATTGTTDDRGGQNGFGDPNGPGGPGGGRGGMQDQNPRRI